VSAADAAQRLNVTEADVLAMLLDGRLTGRAMRGRPLIDLESVKIHTTKARIEEMLEG
jgi:hypothetical protein